MDRRLYVHVGAPKTGTSYLQSLLWAGKHDFKESGVLVPGRGQKAHFAAGSDLLGDPGDDYAERVRRDFRPGAWERLEAKIRASDAPAVVISDERLCRAGPDAAERVRQLADVRSIHVIYTLRSLELTLPSAWQTAVKHGSQATLEKWLDALFDPSAGPNMKDFWRSHDAVRVLTTWSDAFEQPERAHVVTVAASLSDPALLWSRFASVIGLSDDPPAARPRGNEALDYAQVEVLRRLNRRLGKSLPPKERRRLVRNVLATKVMGGSGLGSRATLPEQFAGRVHERAMAMAAELKTAGYDIVGDLEDMTTAPQVIATAPPDEAAVAAAAEQALAGLIERMAQGS